MLNASRHFIFFLILFFQSHNLHATHIVGGYITYKHLGANNYEITLRMYRDCNSGTSGFFPNAIIDIEGLQTPYDTNIFFLKGPTYPHLLDATRCIEVPPSVCIEYADYIDTVNLPPIPGGYNISHITGTRNALIVNLPTPLSRGIYYNTSIPSMDTLGNNSSKFLKPPPVLLCLNQPLADTISFLDLDNDSLSYELCDIYEASGGNPPSIINFISPFSATYPIASNPAIGIDPSTGALFGTPNQIGHYVLGICVTEWRNRVPISTVRLDYQFNVNNCTKIEADIITQLEDSLLYCKGRTVQFHSNTSMSNKFFWDFGDPTTLGDTSTLASPTYTYPNLGNFMVKLIVNPNGFCADTINEIFNIQDVPVVTLNATGDFCDSTQSVLFSARGDIPNSAVFRWSFFSGAVPIYF